MNWLQQVFAVVIFSLRTVPSRLGASATAAVGIAGVVGVLVGVLSIAQGFRHAMTSTGSEDVAIVLRAGANNEMTSGLNREETRLISEAPGIARGVDGALTSPELFVIIDLPKRSTGTLANVPLRGVEKSAFETRGNINIVKGRAIEFGKNEIMAGTGAARAFAGLDVGQSLKIGQNMWEVVGLFTSEGGAAESELWTDAAVLQPAYNRQDSFQSVYVKLSSAGSFSQFKEALTINNPRLKVAVQTLKAFYTEQSEMTTDLITRIGIVIAVMMALGALFGALNTMYSAVSSRTREIATLRALGFGSGPVIISVLAESLALALIGGAVGAGLAYLLFDGYQAATMNFQTFSQVTFAFAVTPQLLLHAVLWASIIGLLGGIFPAIRAARLPIASALRET